VWIDPSEILFIVEIVSPGSGEFDRYLEPIECARAGVRHFWRVERDGPATVHIRARGG
jgi:Uma2 family endonuclease